MSDNEEREDDMNDDSSYFPGSGQYIISAPQGHAGGAGNQDTLDHLLDPPEGAKPKYPYSTLIR